MMKSCDLKSMILAVTLVLFQCIIHGQDLKGSYQGALSRDGSIQLVNFHFSFENGKQSGTYDIPECGLYEVPFDTIFKKNDTLNIKFFYGNFFCFPNDDQKQITGISQGWIPKIRLHLKKSSEGEIPYTKEDIRFLNENVMLSGMLYHPKNPKPTTKYIVLVHGSGPQTRYAPYYISLGFNLVKQGYGVLLFDKRGTGKSTGDFEQATLQELAGDVLSAINYLKGRDDLNISEIGLLGTSQGGWVVPIVANQSNDVSFIILNVGPSVSVYEQSLQQIEYSMKDDNLKKSSVDSAVAYANKYFQFVESGKEKVKNDIVKMWSEIEKKNWAEYISLNPENELDLKWWRVNNYDPETTLKHIKCRVLAIYGEKDVSVPPAENVDKMRSYLDEANTEYKIVTIMGVGHDMLTYQGLNGQNWDWPKVYWQWRNQPDEFMNAIIQFIK